LPLDAPLVWLPRGVTEALGERWSSVVMGCREALEAVTWPPLRQRRQMQSRMVPLLARFVNSVAAMLSPAESAEPPSLNKLHSSTYCLRTIALLAAIDSASRPLAEPGVALEHLTRICEGGWDAFWNGLSAAGASLSKKIKGDAHIMFGGKPQAGAGILDESATSQSRMVPIDILDDLLRTSDLTSLWKAAAMRVLDLYKAAKAEPRQLLIKGVDPGQTIDDMEGKEDRLANHADRVASILCAALHPDDVAMMIRAGDKDMQELMHQARFPGNSRQFHLCRNAFESWAEIRKLTGVE